MRILQNKMVKILLSIMLFFIMLLSADTLIVGYRLSTEYYEDLGNLKACIEDFMILSKGVLPKTVDELIDKGILLKRKDIVFSDEHQYYYCPDIINDAKVGQHLADELVDIDNCVKFNHFERFVVLYGVKVEDIELIDNKLYEKPNGNKVLLITGPDSFLLNRKHCQKVSLELYKIMQQN